MPAHFRGGLVFEIVERARKLLQEMRGQNLTYEQLREIFGTFDSCSDSYAENAEAFAIIFKEGLLIEESPNQYRAASLKEMGSRISKKIEDIRRTIQEAADKIKIIVVKEAKKAENDFPKIFFGDKKKPAIILDLFDEYAIVLTPEGIFKCPYTFTSNSNRIEKRPHWEHRYEYPLLWIEWGEKALVKLARHRK